VSCLSYFVFISLSDLRKTKGLGLIGNRGLEHSADPEEIDDVERFLNESIPPVGDQPSL